MRHVIVLSRSLLVLTFLFVGLFFTAQAATAQSQPISGVPMTPIAQWPPALPAAAPASNQEEPSPSTTAQTLGIGNFTATGSVWSVSTNQESVADAAREARLRLAKDHPRVFTNDDIARLRIAAGEPPTAPATGVITNEQTMPASDVANQAANTRTSGSTQNNLPASNSTTPPANLNQDQNQTKRSPHWRVETDSWSH